MKMADKKPAEAKPQGDGGKAGPKSPKIAVQKQDPQPQVERRVTKK